MPRRQTRRKSSCHPSACRLEIATLDKTDIDRKQVVDLVTQLADDTPAVRDQAFEKLTEYGPGILPILKELFADQPPEAKGRMKQLLRNQTAPLLGGMFLLDNEFRVVNRGADGTVYLYLARGVSMAAKSPDDEPTIQSPAWLAIRPGHPVQLLPEEMVADLTPGKATITSVGDEWVVTSDVRGPRRFLAGALVPVLHPNEAEFTDVVGIDRRGRWLFRKPGQSTPTLVLDPTLPDLTPRLPVWDYATADEVGWDKENWPAVRQLGLLSRLKETDWEALGADTDFLTRPDQIHLAPAASPLTATPNTQPAPATTQPLIQPSTRTTSLPLTQPASAAGPESRPVLGEAATDSTETLLLTTPDGTRYFDGTTELRWIDAKGDRGSWTLPPIDTGKAPVHLVRAPDGRLFLFNQPGRVIRLRRTPAAPDPFTVEATFTRNIPNVETPTRIWLDPAGRIIIAYEKRLAILFPEGYLPRAIRMKMTNVDDGEAEKP